MTELFEGLSVFGDPVSEEDCVVYLLTSLPESYDMLVTALEANVDVPKMEVVTERLLHEERNSKTKEAVLLVRPCLCLVRRKDHDASTVESLDTSGDTVVS